MPEDTSSQEPINESTTTKTKSAAKKASKRKRRKKSGKKKSTKIANSRAKRVTRPYPASSFEDALPLAEAIHQYASGERVRRLTLLKQLDKSPTSSSTRMLITNSGRYGLTTGGYDAEWLELTDLGSIASNPANPLRQKQEARIKLAIQNIAPFNLLYTEYKGKKLPSHDVLKDVLVEGKFEIDNLSECVDLFVVNVKYLGLLQTIAGSETLISVEQALDELGLRGETPEDGSTNLQRAEVSVSLEARSSEATSSKINWERTCFVISPIGEDGSDTRRHADLFLGSLIEPALREFDLDVVRADKIGAAGMITSQIIEYLLRARLAIADLSFHNPNAFYEMAIRHASKLPIVQISRKNDRLPFDVNQVRTVVIDTTDIYSLVPKLETYRSEIATQVRAALTEGNNASNPITTFFPNFSVHIPKEK